MKDANIEHSANMSAFNELGKIIRYHRQKSGLTQAQLAKLAAIGKTAVFDIENGTKRPRIDTVSAIFKILNIKIRYESPLMADYEEERHAQS